MIKPYLVFNGDCETAFALYCKAFNGECTAMQKYGDMPPSPDFPVSKEQKSLVLNAQLRLTESGYIMGCDSTWPSEKGSAVSISVELNSTERAQKAWDTLIEGGEVLMDLTPTFFAKLHGSLKDKYGFSWMFTVT